MGQKIRVEGTERSPLRSGQGLRAETRCLDVGGVHCQGEPLFFNIPYWNGFSDTLLCNPKESGNYAQRNQKKKKNAT